MNIIHLPQEHLAEEGLNMEIEIMPSIDFIQSNHKNKGGIPIVKTSALFDTGSKLCAVDQSIIDDLGVTSRQIVPVKTPFHIVHRAVYQLIYKIPGEKEYFPVTAVVVNLSKDSYKAIIGRDFLQYCTLVYDGATNKSQLHIIK